MPVLWRPRFCFSGLASQISLSLFTRDRGSFLQLTIRFFSPFDDIQYFSRILIAFSKGKKFIFISSLKQCEVLILRAIPVFSSLVSNHSVSQTRRGSPLCLCLWALGLHSLRISAVPDAWAAQSGCSMNSLYYRPPVSLKPHPG